METEFADKASLTPVAIFTTCVLDKDRKEAAVVSAINVKLGKMGPPEGLKEKGFFF